MYRTAAELASDLRTGFPVDDAAFDAYLPPNQWRVSPRYWTPLSVAALAARWLHDLGLRRVLDVGSGAGKFCVAAALASPDLHLVGVEQRGELVSAARVLARRFRTSPRTTFVHARIDEADLTDCDALYLFNPFGENTFGARHRLDDSVELSVERLHRDIARVEHALDALPLGGAVLTYHGFGGQIPDTFDLRRSASVGTDVLRLWVKTRLERQGSRWVEIGEEVVRYPDVEAAHWRYLHIVATELRTLANRA